MKKILKIMKKILKIAGVVLGVLLVALIVMVTVLTRDNRIAESPVKIAKCAGLELPAYIVLEKEDNYDRGASAWSCVEWKVKLETPLSVSFIKSIKDLIWKDLKWRRIGDMYIYNNVGMSEDAPEIHIVINSSTGVVTMSYSWFDMLF